LIRFLRSSAGRLSVVGLKSEEIAQGEAGGTCCDFAVGVGEALKDNRGHADVLRELEEGGPEAEVVGAELIDGIFGGGITLPTDLDMARPSPIEGPALVAARAGKAPRFEATQKRSEDWNQPRLLVADFQRKWRPLHPKSWQNRHKWWAGKSSHHITPDMSISLQEFPALAARADGSSDGQFSADVGYQTSA